MRTLLPQSRRASSLFTVFCLVSVGQAFGQFTTVLNIPPDPNIGFRRSITSDTQLNLFDGGRIGNSFRAGWDRHSDRSTTVEVNIFGGHVGGDFLAELGSTVNIRGGFVSRNFQARSGVIVNISGGLVDDSFSSGTATVNISGGVVGVGFEADAGSNVNITGGVIANSFTADDGSTVNVSGGTIGGTFEAKDEATVNVSGGSFGQLFQARVSTVNISGGSFGESFRAGRGSMVNISGGTFGPDFVAGGDSTLRISGGSFLDEFRAIRDSNVTISDGEFGGVFSSQGLAKISGGSFHGEFHQGIGTVIISGGSFLNNYVVSSNVNVSGGRFADEFDATSNSIVKLFGTQFALDGIDITQSLTLNQPFTIIDRNVTLDGRLADGSDFAFDLNSVDIDGVGYFHPDAMLTVTLVLPGDIDRDGDVDDVDLNNVRNHFGNTGPADGSLPGDTFPYDGTVGIDDLNRVRNHFGENRSNSVPEPAAAVLMMLGAIAFLGGLRSHRRAAILPSVRWGRDAGGTTEARRTLNQR